jgi:hypothetical protein
MYLRKNSSSNDERVGVTSAFTDSPSEGHFCKKTTINDEFIIHNVEQDLPSPPYTHVSETGVFEPRSLRKTDVFPNLHVNLRGVMMT